MRGIGRGRWLRPAAKQTTERCRPLDVNKLASAGVLFAGASGVINWTNAYTSEPRGCAEYSVIRDEDELMLQVCYRWHESESITTPIRLQTTEPYFGGRRWWLTCPLTVDGVACRRRIGKLYLPPGARYFGCRECHRLTYRSCQEAHQAERLFGRVMRHLFWGGTVGGRW